MRKLKNRFKTECETGHDEVEQNLYMYAHHLIT